MKSAGKAAAVATMTLLALGAAKTALAEDPAVWLNVEVRESGMENPKVKVTLPLSLMEVVVNSLDTSNVLSDLKAEKGIDLANLWQNLKNADTDEFVRIEDEGNKVQVYKDGENLRVTVQEEGFSEPNVQIRVPYAVMDYLVEQANSREFRLSDLISQLKGHLPLVLVEATHSGQSVKVWLEER
jgi:hypothetical protein